MPTISRWTPAVLAISIASAPSAAPAHDAAEATTEPPPPLTVTGSATLASQYRFRGISLSDEAPALQATINLNHASGFYAGLWSSSLDGFGELGGSNLELDLYAGYRREVARGVTIDGGLLYYAYPGSSGGDFEYFEPYANVVVTRGPVTAKIGGAFAPSQGAIGNASNLYLYGDAAVVIADSPLTLTSHVGLSDGDTTLTPGGRYLDWSLGATLAWRNLTFGLSYVDTDLGRAEAALGGAAKDIVDAALVATLSATF